MKKLVHFCLIVIVFSAGIRNASAEMATKPLVVETSYMDYVRAEQNKTDSKNVSKEKSSQDKNEWIVVDVHNWGRPLTQEEQERLFDRFYRVNSTQKTEGTGLGLSIVQQLVQKYDGTITVASSPEKGIIFTVSFPLEF